MANALVRVLDDAEGVSRAGAGEFARAAREAVLGRGLFAVALSGGATPLRLYELLAEPPLRDDVDWRKAEFFWSDERAVPPEHADANFRLAWRSLLSRVAVPVERIHRMPADSADLENAAREYEAEIGRVLGASWGGPPPRFDLVLLGLGADGHTASLFPRAPALRETARWVAAADPPAGGAWPRLTLTPVILNRARQVVFLVTGAEKALALATVLEGSPGGERLPAQLIRPDLGTTLWLVDRAAAAHLRRRS